MVDGNKRVCWLSTAFFLDINGVNIAAAINDDVYDFVIAVASEHHDLDWIALGLQRLAG